MIKEHLQKVDLSTYNNDWYNPGAGAIKRSLWYFTNVLFFINPLNPVSSVKVWLLRLFGAKVGKGVMIKPSVNIKYPWLLEIGDYVWVGEEVWIDNLTLVRIGNHVSLSQGAMLLTGSHDYKKPNFDLMVSEILIEEGAWIGAKATVCPGVTCGTHCVLAVGSVATHTLEAYTIYQGNPAVPKRTRQILS
jgi:putative colanic acid biosynthesis acetyltransferase WcaF